MNAAVPGIQRHTRTHAVRTHTHSHTHTHSLTPALYLPLPLCFTLCLVPCLVSIFKISQSQFLSLSLSLYRPVFLLLSNCPLLLCRSFTLSLPFSLPPPVPLSFTCICLSLAVCQSLPLPSSYRSPSCQVSIMSTSSVLFALRREKRSAEAMVEGCHQHQIHH